MDVRLPDGTVIENVPEGTTKAQLVQKLATKGYDVSWYKPEADKPEQKVGYGGTAEEMPWYKQLAAGAGGALTGMGMGIRQMTNLSPPTEEEVKDYQASMQGLRGTGAGFAGEIIGNIAPGAIGMGAVSAIPRVAGLLSGGGVAAAKTIAGLGGAIGAAEGAMTPVTEDQSRLGNVAIQGTLGAVAPAAIGAVTKTLGEAKRAVTPYFSKGARETAAGQMMRDVGGEAAIPSLRNAQAGQTVGQAAVGDNLSELAALQRVAFELNPDAPLARELAQRQSRVDSLLSFGKTPEAVKAAEDARDATFKKAIGSAEEVFGQRRNEAARLFAADPRSVVKEPVYDSLGMLRQVKLKPIEVPAVPAMESLKANPGFKAAIADARRIAAGKTALPEALTGMSDSVRKDVIADPTKSLQGIELIKYAIDQRFANPQSLNTALSKIDDSTLTVLKKTFMNVTDNLSDEYKAARAAFAESSKDITEMKIGQKAADLLSTPLGVKERGAVFARNVDEEVQLLKKAGGFNRKELSEQLKPENMAKIQNVIDELDIDARFQEQAARGMRGERLSGAVGAGVELPHVLNNAVVLANTAIRRLAGGGKIRTIKELSEILLDPKRAADIMEQASVSEKNAIKFLVRAQQTGAIVSPATMETSE